jgi:hypothetical protein
VGEDGILSHNQGRIASRNSPTQLQPDRIFGKDKT